MKYLNVVLVRENLSVNFELCKRLPLLITGPNFNYLLQNTLVPNIERQSGAVRELAAMRMAHNYVSFSDLPNYA